MSQWCKSNDSSVSHHINSVQSLDSSALLLPTPPWHSPLMQTLSCIILIARHSQEPFELPELLSVQWFGETVGSHILGRFVDQFDSAVLNSLSLVVVGNCNMLCPNPELGVLSNSFGALVVCIDGNR